MKSILIVFGGLLLSGCFVVRRDVIPFNPMSDSWGNRNTYYEFASNGEQIYFTAINEHGQRIRYSAGPNFGRMMMGMSRDLACVSCHASDGRGGVHMMHMQVMDAPDIRYSALISEGDEHGDDEPHADEHSGYDLEAFRLALVEGKHPSGEALSREMPRWRINDQDLKDLFEYLKTLP